MCWGGSRSTKPCIFPCKVAAARDERYLVCAAVAAAVVPDAIGSSSVFCNEWLFHVVPACVFLCVSWSCGCRSHWNGCMNVAWGLCWGGSRSTKPCIFRVKRLQPAMKGTSCVRRLRLRSFRTRLVPPLCSATSGCSMLFLRAYFFAFLEAVVADRIGMAAWMLHGACVGEEAAARNLLFFRVKWLQPAMKGTSCVRRLRLRSFRTRLVPPLCSAKSGCSMLFLCA